MISATQIQRMLGARQHARLVDRILRNGRCEDQAVRSLLMDSPTVEPVALGLAAQRLLELDYGRSPLVDGLARRIAHRLERARPAPASDHGALAALSIMTNALLDWLDLAPARKSEDPGGTALRALVKRAAMRGLHVLAGAQDADGSLGASALLSSIVLWQLGDHDAFRRAVRCHDLKHWLATRSDHAASPSLRAFAYACAA